MTPRTFIECLSDLFEDRTRALVVTLGILMVQIVPMLAGCSTAPFIPDNQGQSQANFVVQWRTPLEIIQLCGSPRSLACTINKHLIITRPIRSWSDDGAICALGHETAHILGAVHD